MYIYILIFVLSLFIFINKYGLYEIFNCMGWGVILLFLCMHVMLPALHPFVSSTSWVYISWTQILSMEFWWLDQSFPFITNRLDMNKSISIHFLFDLISFVIRIRIQTHQIQGRGCTQLIFLHHQYFAKNAITNVTTSDNVLQCSRVLKLSLLRAI